MIKMPRPRLCRRVMFEPNVVCFKPTGIIGAKLEKTILAVDELEAIRLKDVDGLEQEECAKKMNISQPTFYRLLSSARKKIADSIVNGKMLKIEGGNFKTYGHGPGHSPGHRRGYRHAQDHNHAYVHNEI